jgi:hypothetical protein
MMALRQINTTRIVAKAVGDQDQTSLMMDRMLKFIKRFTFSICRRIHLGTGARRAGYRMRSFAAMNRYAPDRSG